MIRNLKVLVAAAMALAAFGAFSASGAQAAPEFHCSVEPCIGVLKPDEAANTKTAHHVFVIENAAKTESVSFTCGQLSGKGKTSTKTASSFEAGNFAALSYSECLVNGSGAMTIDMNGCKYNYTAGGTVTITGCTNAAKQIEMTFSGCTFDIPEQGPLSTITYHNIGTSPNREVTVSANVTGIKVTATGLKANCFINPEQTLTGTYTTGNTLVTGQTEAGVMADAWWLSQDTPFHCSVEPCVGTLRPDETANSKTSHHVFIIENAAKTESVSFTCGQLDGHTTKAVAKTPSEVEFGGVVGATNALVYRECLVNGSDVVLVDMNGCKYNFTASGTVTITDCANANKQIEITKENCVYNVKEQGPLSTISYHTIGTTPKREITGSANVTGIAVTAIGTKAGCLIEPNQTLTGTYTTGNTLVRGETEAGVMADAWWE